MSRIYEVEPLVKEALIKKPETRGDNFLLYIEVLKKFINVDASLSFVFTHHKELGIPSLESITRARRKLQEKDHTLKEDPKTEGIRWNDETEFRDYAKDKLP